MSRQRDEATRIRNQWPAIPAILATAAILSGTWGVEAQEVEAQKVEAQKVEAQEVEAQKVEAQKVEAPIPVASIPDADNDRVAKALDAAQSFSFVDSPLSDVVEDLRQRFAAPLLIDTRALEEQGIDVSIPVTINVENVSARSALRRMLRPLNLTYVVRNGVLRITTPEAAESELVTRVYPVRDLMAPQDAISGSDWLVELCTTLVSPDSWAEEGGPGNLRSAGQLLIISQTSKRHDELAALLTTLRTAFRSQQVDSFRIGATSSSMNIEKALQKPTQLEFEHAPLSEALEFLSDKHQIPIVVDALALANSGQEVDHPTTIRLKAIPLQIGLDALLGPLELTVVIRDEVLVVTTIEEAEANLTTRIYPLKGLPAAIVESLDETIQSAIQPDSWDVVGGYGSIGSVPLKPGFLVISQTDAAHREVARLFRHLRAASPDAGDNAQGFKPVQTMEVFVFTEESLLRPQEALELVKAAIPLELLREEGGLAMATKDLLIVRHREEVKRQIRKVLSRFNVVSDTHGGGGGFGGGDGFGGGGFGGGGGGFGGGGTFFSVPSPLPGKTR